MLSTNLLFLRSNDLNSSRPIFHGGLLSLLLDTFLKTYRVVKHLTKSSKGSLPYLSSIYYLLSLLTYRFIAQSFTFLMAELRQYALIEHFLEESTQKMRRDTNTFTNSHLS